MTMTFDDVRRWSAQPLDAVFDDLRARKNDLVGLQDELDGAARPKEWEGKAADRAVATHKKLSNRLENLVGELAAVQRAVADTADAMTGVADAIAEADALAASQSYRITHKGEVVETVPVSDPPPDRELVKAEVGERVRQIMRRAKDIDDDLAKLLAKAADGRIDVDDATGLTAAAAAGDGKGDLSIPGPPKHATAAASAGWWDTLSKDEKAWVVRNRPDWIGNRDGIPATARHDANMIRLDSERARLKSMRAGLKNLPPEALYPGARHARDRIDAKLRALDDLEAAVRDGRQLLVLDTSHHDIRAAVAVGQVDNAKDVAVFVPGVSTGVNKDDLHAGLEDSGYLQAEADRINGGEQGDAAVIWWLDYNPPDSFDSAPFTGGHAARSGADDLTDYLRGINAAAENDPHLTVVGHSLGSTTAGYALRAESGVDDLVVAGSPGLGTDDFSRLKVPDQHMHVLEAKGDWIADTGYFGKDPSLNQDAVQPSTDGASGHSEYFDKGTASAKNTAAVIAGQY